MKNSELNVLKMPWHSLRAQKANIPWFYIRLIKKDGLQPLTLPEVSIINRFENISSLCQSHTFGKGGSHMFGSCMCYLATTSSLSVPLWPEKAVLSSANIMDEGQVRASICAAGQRIFLSKIS